MSSKEKLVYAIIKFLHKESHSGAMSEDATESIEVARQCIETAYGIDLQRSDLDSDTTLEQLMDTLQMGGVQLSQIEVTPEMKVEAESLKNKGNDFMKKDMFSEAVTAYSDAIITDPTNAIYFSNRAAAYNKLQRYQEAVDDCNAAIAVDPSYSKAHGRKGLALSGLGQHNEAIKCYETAIQLDPDNQNFKTNLEIAKEKAQSAPALPGGLGALLGGGGGGMPDLAAIMNNPAMMNMAQQMMQNPAMQQMMGNLMSGIANQQSGEIGAPAAGTPPNMEQLLRTGQQMAEQMQQSNPELVEQLKNQFQGNQQPPPSGGSGSV